MPSEQLCIRPGSAEVAADNDALSRVSSSSAMTGPSWRHVASMSPARASNLHGTDEGAPFSPTSALN